MMFDTSKLNNEILNLSNCDEIKKHICDYAFDLINKDYCKEILSGEISDFDKDDIKEFIIKYINIKNENVTRKIKIKQYLKKTRYAKGVYDRLSIIPFGKALEGNNSPTIENEITITKTLNKTIENNIKS